MSSSLSPSSMTLKVFMNSLELIMPSLFSSKAKKACLTLRFFSLILALTLVSIFSSKDSPWSVPVILPQNTL